MSSPKRSKDRIITEGELKGYKYYEQLLPLQEGLHADATGRDKAGNRKLYYDQYVSLLLAFFNPIISSLRGLQQAAGLAKVQRLLGVKRASLGALSAAAADFDPALLRAIVHELAGRAVLAIQCYCALIASLMIVLWTGLHPTKRTWEMIQHYLAGWATLEELENHLAGRRRAATPSNHALAPIPPQ